MGVARREDWEQRLAHFILGRLNAPFAWGEHDCCLFACDAIQEMYDVDIAAEFRGRYHTPIGAYDLLKTATNGGGVAELAEQTAKYWKLEEMKPVHHARRADLALIQELADFPALGIVDFDGRNVLSAGEKGLTRTPLRQALRAWRLP